MPTFDVVTDGLAPDAEAFAAFAGRWWCCTGATDAPAIAATANEQNVIRPCKAQTKHKKSL